MTATETVSAEDVVLMQGLAQRVMARRLELINADASYGELAWNWGKGHANDGYAWRRELWFNGDELDAWAWVQLPRQVTRSDGSVGDVTDAYLMYLVHPDRPDLIDEVIDWCESIAGHVDRLVLPCEPDRVARERWAGRGYQTDPDSAGDEGEWTQMNERELDHIEQPELAEGYRFRTADEAGAKAATQAHLDAWAPSTYSLEAYLGVRSAPGYRGDLHVLVEAPDGTMAASAITWLDEVNNIAEFEPVGTHPEHRRRGLARALLLHGMQLAKAAGATRMMVASEGGPTEVRARELYYSLGFKEISRDAPMVKSAN